MDTTLTLVASASATASGGRAVASLGPVVQGERWHIASTTCTSNNYTVTVSRNGITSDTTANDPRPTATDSTQFDLAAGENLTVTWTPQVGGTLPDGTVLTVTVQGTRTLRGWIAY